MSETKLKELSVPDAQAGELIAFLVRPVKALEDKLQEMEKALQANVQSVQIANDKLFARVQQVEDKIEEARAAPRKHENRLSALEGQAKHVPGLQEDAKALLAKMAKAEQEIHECKAALHEAGEYRKEHGRELKKHDKEIDRHRSGLEELARKLDEKAEAMREMQAGLKEMRAECNKAMDQLRHEHALAHEKLRHDLTLAFSKIEDCNRNQLQYVKESDAARQACEQRMAERADKDMQRMEGMERKMDQVLTEGEEWSVKVHHKLEDFARSLELLEERFDKFSMRLKEVKAAVGA